MKTITLRIPDELLSESNAILDRMGLDLPTALRIFLTKVAATRSIPFELKAPYAVWEEVAVDAKTQKKMDRIGALWDKNPR